MRILATSAGGLLALSVVGMLGIWIYGLIGTARGEDWGSLDGPGPVWPAVIGFGSLNLFFVSIAALGLLAIVGFIRALWRRSESA